VLALHYHPATRPGPPPRRRRETLHHDYSKIRAKDSNQQSAISNQQSAISNQQSAISRQPSAVSRQPSAVSRLDPWAGYSVIHRSDTVRKLIADR